MRIHPIANKIFDVLRYAKEPLWMREIARMLKIPEGSISYYIFGQKKKLKNEIKEYGGYLKDAVFVVAKEGNNKKIFLKVREKELRKSMKK